MPEHAPQSNPFPEAWAQFTSETTDHALTIHHDDGLYRHLTMARPGVLMWSWSVVTWPGYLSVVGDIGRGYIWHREADMLAWADTTRYQPYSDGAPVIQADYWAEKLTNACQASARQFDSAVFLRLVGSHLAETEHDDAGTLLAEASAAAASGDEHAAREWLHDTEAFDGSDCWEWNLTSFDRHYLLACYALATTIQAFRRAQAEHALIPSGPHADDAHLRYGRAEEPR